MAFEPLSSFYQRVLSGALLVVIITGLYFYSKSYVEPQTRKNMGFNIIEREQRSLAPQWLLKVHNPSSVTYVNYWSYQCPPCLEEFPFLVKLQQEGPQKGHHVLFINVDGGWGEEHIKNAKDYLSKNFPQAQSLYSHPAAWDVLKKVGAPLPPNDR